MLNPCPALLQDEVEEQRMSEDEDGGQVHAKVGLLQQRLQANDKHATCPAAGCVAVQLHISIRWKW